ncbi:condensation domain-containing protein [Streptomyces sp. V4-01]|uniref:Condensation domain-containing protein n=1 Tax=Actinacidiphila polyblastidii TaxID=3110430 RepID=A0ABU7P660_9ACTN|nr:condensation domain-containing protein [Streptomyces sp. V4-01]
MQELQGRLRYPLSAQLTMCCVNEAAGQDMDRYIMPMALRIKGTLDSAALQGALDDVVVRHESLRTVITSPAQDGGDGHQSVLPPAPVPFTQHRLETGPDKSREDLAEELLADLYTQTMSRNHSPLLRAALYRFDDRDAVLTLVTHHIAGDAWSAGVLRRDLAAFYQARTAGTAPALPPVRQYGEYATWQQRTLNEAKARATRAYWAGHLAGAAVFAPPADRLPADRPSADRPFAAPGEAPYGTLTFDLTPGEMAAVRARAKAERASTWHVLVAAGALLANGLTGTSDPALMTVRAPRDHPTFLDTIGNFVDALPLRVDLDGCATLRDVLLSARTTCLQAYRHPMPNNELERRMPAFMRPNEQPGNVPLFFNYLRPLPGPDEIPFAEGAERVTFREEIPFDRGGRCIWGMWELSSGGLMGQLEYPPDRLEAGTVERWTGDFRDLVLRIAQTPDQPWRDN